MDPLSLILLAVVSGILTTGISAAGNIAMTNHQNEFNQTEAEKQREWQSNENEIARNFEKEMSSTAFQRQVADMKAAGLNPGAIGSGSGASTPQSNPGGGYAASASAGNLLNGSGINGFLNSVGSQAAMSMIRKNPDKFGKEMANVVNSSQSSAPHLAREKSVVKLARTRGSEYYDPKYRQMTDDEILDDLIMKV